MSGEVAAVLVALEQLGRYQERGAEEARAAARDINRRFDRFEDVVGKRFDAVDGRIAAARDHRRIEHAEFRASIEGIQDRLDAEESEARGRAQIWSGFGKLAKLAGDHSWMLLALGFGGWTLAEDIAPAIAAVITPAPVAAMQALRDANQTVVLPIPREAALRGPLTD